MRKKQQVNTFIYLNNTPGNILILQVKVLQLQVNVGVTIVQVLLASSHVDAHQLGNMLLHLTEVLCQAWYCDVPKRLVLALQLLCLLHGGL